MTLTIDKKKSLSELSSQKREEMSRAAAAAVAIALASTRKAEPKRNSQTSAWVVQSRIVMTSRWPG